MTEHNNEQGAWSASSNRPRPRINIADPLQPAQPQGAHQDATQKTQAQAPVRDQNQAQTQARAQAPAQAAYRQAPGRQAQATHQQTRRQAPAARAQQAYQQQGRAENAYPAQRQGSYPNQDTAQAGPRQYKQAPPRKKRRAPKVIAVLAIVLVVAGAAAGGGWWWYNNHAVEVTLNGAATTIEGSQRSIQGLIDAGTVTPTAGNHLAVDGSVIQQGGGNAATVKLNNAETSDFSKLLMDGDTIEVTNGSDTTEEYTEETKETKPAKASVKVTGAGAIHKVSAPSKETVKVLTGKESGKTKTEVVKKSSGLTVTKCNASTSKKVIALTFDDGPWPTTTDQILDILAENDAKATFFTIGKQIASRTSSVKRMKEAGHQICTHTYDHASGSGRGVNITYMSASEQKKEVKKGYAAIKAVTGEDASTVVRLPGGNVNEDTYSNLSNLISAEINWNVDTEDWSRPGVDAIYNRIVNASSGNIILMHDGGGDRSQTVAALKKALPVLKGKGYSFVTIDELLKENQ